MVGKDVSGLLGHGYQRLRTSRFRMTVELPRLQCLINVVNQGISTYHVRSTVRSKWNFRLEASIAMGLFI
jgi:hypothetical protein